MKVIDLDQSADDAAVLLKALSSPTRLKILCMLVPGERSVSRIAEQLRLRDANVSQHLTLLRKDGLVRTRRDGRTIHYSIGDPSVLRLLQTLHGIFCKPAGRRRRT